MNKLPCAIASHEGNSLDIRMFGDVLNGLKAALDHLKDAFWQVDLLDQIG